MAYWLGIDIGTGGSRALLIDEKGSIVSAVTAPHKDMTMEKPLWAEQDPDDWWSASQKAVQQVLQQSGAYANEIKGIGLSGQMHGLVLLDEIGKVIRPSLIWCDQRSQAQVDWINAKATAAKVLACTANPVLTGFTLPKLLWVRDNEPANYERGRMMLLPKDYIRYKLTGEYATEVSDASGTALFDVVKRDWSYELASIVGVDKSMLPKSYESSRVTGYITKEVAAATGLALGTPVVGGGGDQAASAVGNGIVRAGIVSCTIGTSGVVFGHMEQPAYDPKGRVHTFCHAVDGKWHVMGVTQGAGLSLQWLRNQLMPGMDYDAMTDEASTAPAGSEGLYWLPYLMGERTPHLDSTARAAWVGLTAKHTRAHMIRSVLEGVAYSQMDCLEIIEELGTVVENVRISGGGAKSAFWRQMFADVFHKRVVTLETQEGSAYGAALLATVGTGHFGSVAEACDATIRETSTTMPNAVDSQRYTKGHKVYKSIYPALKPVYGSL